jgi:hypothetical protein
MFAVSLGGCTPINEQSRNGLRLLTASGAQPGDEALITGTVAVTDGGCVGLATAATIHLVIWPNGTSLEQSDLLKIRLPTGELLGEGDQVEGAGGYYTSPREFQDQIDTCEADDEVIRVRFD